MDLLILWICVFRDLQILRFMDFNDIPKDMFTRIVILNGGQFVWRRRNRDSFDSNMTVCASGFVLGEEVFVVISANRCNAPPSPCTM